MSLLSFGAMVGALSAGQLAETLGRRKSISIVSGIFVLGTFICCVAGRCVDPLAAIVHCPLHSHAADLLSGSNAA